MRHLRLGLHIGVSGLWLLLCSPTANAQKPASTQYENLQVLGPHTTRDELGDAMINNLRGLGLRRNQREGCLYCHVGSMDQPVSEWDFPSDEKPEKLTARVMMAMVNEINQQHLSKLDGRKDDGFEVTCFTCHAGRTDPRPLDVVLADTYSKHGIAETVQKYEALRERYYGAGAYDFRPFVVNRVAFDMAAAGAWEDGIALVKANEAADPFSIGPPQARLKLEIYKRLEQDGLATALRHFDTARQSERENVVDHSILDGIGWGLYRDGREADAMVVFRRNKQLFPDRYVPNESLADALWSQGEQAKAVAVLQSWLDENPQDKRGSSRLINMQDQLAERN